MTETVVSASVLIIVLTVLRFLFRKKISRRLQYALWGLVLLRLLLPFSLADSRVSVVNILSPEKLGNSLSEIQVYSDIILNTDMTPTEASAVGIGTLHEIQGTPAASGLKASKNYIFTDSLDAVLRRVLGGVWQIGAAVTGLWFIAANTVLYLKLRKTRVSLSASDCRLPVYVTDCVVSPCLFGFFHPAIYLTPKAAENKKALHYILTHELCHYRHGDHIWMLLRQVCLTAYWWNPLVWAAALLSRSDGELACDEAVIRLIGKENRLSYGQTILEMIAVIKEPQNFISTAMSAGKRSMNDRLKMLIDIPKAFFPVVLAVLLLTAAAAAATFTGEVPGPPQPSYNIDTGNSVTSDTSGSRVNRTNIEACVSDTILSHKSGLAEGDFTAEAHTTLKVVEDGSFVTVYTIALLANFSYNDDGMTLTSGSHMPTAIAFSKNDKGEFALYEFWVPRDGGLYTPSLKEKFPSDLYDSGMLDTQRYVTAHMQSCYAQAIVYGGIDAAAQIRTLVDTICSSPSESSNPLDYIDSHPSKFRELLYYGDHALYYIISEFLAGGQTGLPGQIMLSAMRVLLSAEDMTFDAETGQAWFDAWKTEVLRSKDSAAMSLIKANYPMTYTLLQTLPE